MLGEVGENPIICFGINPSTANDEKDDPTISKIRKIASENNCDGWIMLNLYPQRATNPNDMHIKAADDLTVKNYEVIRSVFNIYSNALTLASWGNAIEKRKYLKDCLKEILAIDPDRKWVCRGKLTVKGNPRHQLYYSIIPNYKIYILAQREKFYVAKIEKIMVYRCIQLLINNVYENLNLENSSI